MGTGYVLVDEWGEELFGVSSFIQSNNSTNILAEMLAIESALCAIKSLQCGFNWVVWCDCEYVVHSCDRPDLVRKSHLIPVMNRIQSLMDDLRRLVVVKYIPREENTFADVLSKKMFKMGYNGFT